MCPLQGACCIKYFLLDMGGNTKLLTLLHFSYHCPQYNASSCHLGIIEGIRMLWSQWNGSKNRRQFSL